MDLVFFIHSDTLCLLIGSFSSFTFKVIIDSYVFIAFYYLFCHCFWRFSLFLSSLCHFWSFFPTQRVPFNISCRAGLVVVNSFSFCLSENSLSFLLFWMIALLARVFLAAYFSHSACWIYHAIFFWLARFLWRDLLLTLFVFPCQLGTSFVLLLLGFFLYCYILQIKL